MQTRGRRRGNGTMRLILGLGLLALGLGACGASSSDGITKPDASEATEPDGDVVTTPEPEPEPDAAPSLEPSPEPADAAGGSEDAAEPEAATDTGDAEPEVVDSLEPECTESLATFDCDDEDECTDDLCAGGACTSVPIEGCCLTAQDCDDGVDCTEDTCNGITKQCLHVFEDNHCCLDAADCEDSDTCTADLCAANRCVHPKVGCPCSSGPSCSDDNPCTAETCVDAACEYEPVAGQGCCGDDAGCDDGDASTADQCHEGLCWHGPSSCAADSNCSSPDPCKAATCEAGACHFAAIAGCCALDSHCDDGHEATEDRCLEGSCASWIGEAPACSTSAECPTFLECAEVSCVEAAGRCTLSPVAGEGCCTSLADCPVAAPCETVSCVGLTCSSAPLEGWDVLAAWSLDEPGALSTWALEVDDSGALWQLHDAQALSAPNSLYYGKLPEQTYDVGSTSGSATTPLVTPPAGVELQLHFGFNADIEPITSTDKLWVEVVPGSQDAVGAEVWDKNAAGGPGTTWKDAMVPLGTQEAPFALRFAFDSVDEKSNEGDGVFVDGIEVRRGCP